MSTTPLLGITELTTNQTGKEVTINNAIIALENAIAASLAVDLSAGDVTLSVAQFTGAFLFAVNGQTVQRHLNLPAQVNGVNVQRLFAVRNKSALFPAVVQVTGAPGTTVTIPVNESRLLDVDGAGNVRVVAMAPQFTGLSDVPSSYVGNAKKIVRVNTTENGLEFRSPQLADLTVDVDVTSTPPSDGMVLLYSAVQSKWIPGTVSVGGGGGTGSGVASMNKKSASGFAAAFPTVVNTLLMTEVDGKGLYLSGAAVAGPQTRYALKALPAADTTVTVAVHSSLLANFNRMGLVFKDNATGKLLTLTVDYNGGVGEVACESWTSDTVRSATVATGEATNGVEFMYLRFVYTNATKVLDCYFSHDGVSWNKFVTSNAFLASPSHYGVLYTNWNATLPGGGYIAYFDDGSINWDFDPFNVVSLNIGTVSLSYRIALGFEDNIASINYVIGRHCCVETFSIPANFANSVASIAANPMSGPMNITFKKNGVHVGDVTISTTGVITMSTVSGAAINCLTGDTLVASVDGTDANAAGFAMTIKA